MRTLLSILLVSAGLNLTASEAIIKAADHPNLQSALDAVPAKGGVVYLPPGDFEITEPLILVSEDTRIEGSGSSSHIINKNTDGQPALIVHNKDYPKNSRARNWRVHLSNFRISGTEKSGDGILAQGIQEIFIHGMSIDHNGGHGIHLEFCYEDPRVSDSILTYNKKSGLLITGGHDIVVNGNHFEENLDAVTCLNSFNLCMNGNNLDDHIRHGVVIENTYGSVLSGNMIEECNDTAIILDRDCYGITISANVIAHHLGGGVKLLDAWGSTVSANTFVLVHKSSVYVSPESGRITITGNNFSNSYIGGKIKRVIESKNPMQRDEGTGVHLDNTRSVSITGNSFSGLSTPAVWSSGDTSQVIIANNMVEDIGRGSKGKMKAFKLDGATKVIEKDNLVTD